MHNLNLQSLDDEMRHKLDETLTNTNTKPHKGTWKSTERANVLRDRHKATGTHNALMSERVVTDR